MVCGFLQKKPSKDYWDPETEGSFAPSQISDTEEDDPAQGIASWAKWTVSSVDGASCSDKWNFKFTRASAADGNNPKSRAANVSGQATGLCVQEHPSQRDQANSEAVFGTGRTRKMWEEVTQGRH